MKIEPDTLKKYCYDNETLQGWMNHMSESHFSCESLKVMTAEYAICIPDAGLYECFSGGVYSAEYDPIELSFQRKGLLTAKDLIQKTDTSNIGVIDEEVIYLGQYRNQWGSFLIDSISRLWFAKDDPKRYKYVFLGTNITLGSIHKNAYEFLELFGIQKEQIIYITKPTKFQKIIIPEMSYTPLTVWHKEYLDTIYKVVDNSSVTSFKTYDKIYFSRSKFTRKSKSDFGEEFIVEFFKQNGYHIVYPEEHTLSEQIALVNHCKVFASIGGSCAHNIIFSKNSPKVILFNRMNGYQWHQWMLDEMAKVEPVTYVDAYIEPYKAIYKTRIGGPYLYWMTPNVDNFSRDTGLIKPAIRYFFLKKITCFLKYTFYCLYSVAERMKVSIVK